MLIFAVVYALWDDWQKKHSCLYCGKLNWRHDDSCPMNKLNG